MLASAGTGTPDTKWYADNPEADTFYIYNADQLAGVAELVNGVEYDFDANGTRIRKDAEGENRAADFEGKTVIMANDISLSAYGKGAAFNGGNGWIPIGTTLGDRANFRGVFDGNGKKITGLYIRADSLDDVGLFGAARLVKNLGVIDVDITGDLKVGGVTGAGNVENCYVTGAVTGKVSVGGVAGSGWYLANCYSSCTVSGEYNVGGVVGFVWGRRVTNCYSTGVVSGSKAVGGVVGTVRSYWGSRRAPKYGKGENRSGYFLDGVVENCAALNPSVNSLCLNAGRVVGRIEVKPVTLSNNAAFSGLANVAGNTVWPAIGAEDRDGINITAEDILTDGTFGGRFKAENGWTVEKGKLPGLGGKAVEIPAHLR
jgi:hypothetical protein